MAECEGMATCPAYNGINSEETKEKYCRNNNLHCARYLVYNSCGKENIPADLKPEDKTRAYIIIAEKG